MILDFLNPIVGTISVPSRAKNLASNYDCSNPYGFRDIAFFMIFFPKNVDIKKLTKLDFLKPIVGSYQGTLQS